MYYKLFVFVSSIAKISCILFVSCFVKQHPGRNFVLVEIYDCEILSLRCLIGPMFSLAIVYVIFARWPLPNTSTESSRRHHHTHLTCKFTGTGKFGGDLASGDLFVYVSFVFVAQIKFQVEDYLCRHIKFTNTQIENGHFVMCKCASV